MMIVLGFMFTMSSVMIAMSRSLKISQGGASADQALLNAQVGLELGFYQQNKASTYDSLVTAMNNGVTPQGQGEIQIAEGSYVKFKITDTIAGGGKVCADEKYTSAASTDFTKSDDITKHCTETNRYYSYPFPGSGTLGGSFCNANTQPVIKNEQWYRDMYRYITGNPYTQKEMLSTMTGTTPNPTDKAKSSYSPSEVVSYLNKDDKKFTALDHPCLWNKLEPGVAAEVPLFNNESGPENLKEFWLRIRLPCKQGLICSTVPNDNQNKNSSERMDLANTKGQNQSQEEFKNERMLLWEIVANCKKGNEDEFLCYVRDTNPGEVENSGIEGINKDFQHSLINALAFQDNKIYTKTFFNTVLGLVNSGNKSIYAHGYEKENEYLKITDFLWSQNSQAGINVLKPLFHLSIAANLKTSGASKSTTQDIPSVEYQILYKPNIQSQKPLISNPTVTSTGQKGGYTINLESSLTKQTGAFGYALIGK